MTSWTDPRLVELRVKHIKALNAWHDVAPETEGPHADESLTAEQRGAMQAAMEAEHMYVDALMAAGFVPH